MITKTTNLGIWYLAAGAIFTLPGLHLHLPVHVCRKLIDRIDTDGNQELSRGEMIAQLERVDRGYFQQDLEQRWPQADLDGDGYVTRKEYLRSVGQGGW